MGRTRDGMVLPVVLKLLGSRHVEVRQSAAVGLGYLAPEGDSWVVSQLNRAYRHSNDQAIRGYALISMGMVGGTDAIERLCWAASSGQSLACPWACLGLGLALRKTDDDQGQKMLLKHLSHNSNRSFRGAAAVALGLAQADEALNPLIAGLKEGDDPYLRGYCSLALGMIGSRAAHPHLALALKNDPLPTVKIQSGMALALMNEGQSAPELFDFLLTCPNMSTKAFLSLTLGFMADIQIVGRVLDELERDTAELDDQTRASLVLLASKLVSGRTLPYLEPLAARSNFAGEFPMKRFLLNVGL
jgi:HEAT repeat protein